MSAAEPTVADLLAGCGSANHDGSMTPPEVQAILGDIHPAVMGSIVRRWADAREEFGGSGAEHPHFREAVEAVLDNHPDGYGGEDGR